MRRPGLALGLALLLTACGGRDIYRGALVLGGEHTLPSLAGDLVLLSGRVTVPAGGRVSGDAYVLSGDLTVAGRVGGEVTALGGRVALAAGASVGGDLKVLGAGLDLAPGARVAGRVQRSLEGALPQRTPPSPLSRAAQLLGGTLVAAVLAALLARTAPRPLERVADALRRHPVVSAATGILGGAVALSLLVAMLFTLVLLPVTLLGAALLAAAVALGWAACGAALGARLAPARPGPVRAALGTALLVVLGGLTGGLPAVGDLFSLAVAVVGLGAALLTRLGFTRFVMEDEA